MSPMIPAIIILPAVAGLASYCIRGNGLRRAIWISTAVAHLAMAIMVATSGAEPAANAWLGADALSKIFIMLTSALFLAASFYGIYYVGNASQEPVGGPFDIPFVTSAREAIFTGSMLLFLASMSLVILSRHFGLQWVAIEATTLASASLIYYNRSRRSLEAAWKYLMICSVAIALALLGIFFLAMSAPAGVEGFTLDEISRHAKSLNREWLEMAFIFLIVGYGTKMGLAPMHTWLPDAHSEAPAPISALLSGALLNCAFIGILRMQQALVAAGIGGFGEKLFVAFGFCSMAVAGIFILRQPDYKRMLAYSSVEHMGVMALGIGFGGAAVFGALLHAVCHSLVKSALFMTSGNIYFGFGHSKRVASVEGLRSVLPATAALWFAGFLAAVGAPPFGIFLSEFTILKAALDSDKWVASGVYLFMLAIVFVGMLGAFVRMTFGESGERRRESALSVAPQVALLCAALVIGLRIPDFLYRLLVEAALALGGRGL